MENKSKAYRKVKSSQALLSGILRCSNCGSYMRPKSVQRTNPQGERVFYYMCELKEKSRKSRCCISNINGNTLDACILNALKNIAANYSPLFDEVLGNKILVEVCRNKRVSEIETLQAKITEMDMWINNFVTAIAKGQKAEVLTVICKNLEGMTIERGNLKKKLMELQEAEKFQDTNDIKLEPIVHSIGNMDDSAWDSMNVDTKRRMLNSAVDKIFWDGTKLDILLIGSRENDSVEGKKVCRH